MLSRFQESEAGLILMAKAGYAQGRLCGCQYDCVEGPLYYGAGIRGRAQLRSFNRVGQARECIEGPSDSMELAPRGDRER